MATSQEEVKESRILRESGRHIVSHVEPQPFRLRDFRTSRRFRILANSIQDLALQHFALRNPVLALSDTTQISSDRYLMSLPQNEVVVAVPRDQWDRMYKMYEARGTFGFLCFSSIFLREYHSCELFIRRRQKDNCYCIYTF